MRQPGPIRGVRMRMQRNSKTTLARRVIAVLTCLAILVVPQAPAVAAPGCKSKACRDRDRPPTIEGVPSSQVTAGQTYSFTPTATDPEGKSLSFSIVNRPAWLSFSNSTGRLSGIPASSAAGEYVEIRIQVSDGRSTATLGPFSITVLDANRAPNIGGAPPTAAREGQFYEFTPTATDADSDTLTFSISQSSCVGEFQQRNRPAHRHAGSRHRRNLCEHHDSCQRWHARRIAFAVLDRRTAGVVRQRYAVLAAADSTHRRFAADQSGWLPDPLWHCARQLSEHAADRQPRCHDGSSSKICRPGLITSL